MTCQHCPHCHDLGRGNQYDVHSDGNWTGFQYVSPERPMGPDEHHTESRLSRSDARRFFQFFELMGFSPVAWKAKAKKDNSISYLRVRL